MPVPCTENTTSAASGSCRSVPSAAVSTRTRWRRGLTATTCAGARSGLSATVVVADVGVDASGCGSGPTRRCVPTAKRAGRARRRAWTTPPAMRSTRNARPRRVEARLGWRRTGCRSRCRGTGRARRGCGWRRSTGRRAGRRCVRGHGVGHEVLERRRAAEQVALHDGERRRAGPEVQDPGPQAGAEAGRRRGRWPSSRPWAGPAAGVMSTSAAPASRPSTGSRRAGAGGRTENRARVGGPVEERGEQVGTGHRRSLPPDELVIRSGGNPPDLITGSQAGTDVVGAGRSPAPRVRWAWRQPGGCRSGRQPEPASAASFGGRASGGATRGWRSARAQ